MQVTGFGKQPAMCDWAKSKAISRLNDAERRCWARQTKRDICPFRARATGALLIHGKLTGRPDCPGSN
jgi:hypothetical protein